MIIRKETTSDIEAITQVTIAAFRTLQISNHTEQFIIKALRAAGALTLSLVAEINDRVVGHIAFSPVTISDGTGDWYGLGPVSVLPEYQKQGIGKSLINEGLSLLKQLGGRGCALVGDPNYYIRFGFKNFPELVHEGVPQEVFVAKPLVGRVPSGTVEFHQAFKQLSVIEKDAIADVIIDYAISGVRLDLANPAVDSLIEKEILTEMPDGKFVMRPSALAEYDSYLAQVGRLRAAEMSRVHKNPILAAIKYGTGA